MASRARNLANLSSGSAGIVPGSWTTGTRPSSPAPGQFGFNTTLGYMEWYSSSTSLWTPMYQAASYSVDYLIVAGGAGGGGCAVNSGLAGGGGAGGYLASTYTVTSATSYTVTVGAGGAGGSGVVILSVPTLAYSGTTTGSPTVTTSGSNTILTFTSSGSYTA